MERRILMFTSHSKYHIQSSGYKFLKLFSCM